MAVILESSIEKYPGHQSLLQSASVTRLCRLQKLCHATLKASPSALLFIGGVDGKFNVYSHAILKYLFLGATGRDLRNPEMGVQHEALEDCVVIVMRHDVHVLYSEAATHIILPVIAGWPRCREYCLPIADGEDNDIFEQHKVEAFRLMLRTAIARGSNVGLPFPRGCEDFRDIEMWPIVRSFALCGNGDDSGGGLFTVEYTLQDIADALLTVFGGMDALVIEACVLRGSKSLANHLSAMHRVLHTKHAREGGGRGRLDVSEQELAAPLQLLHDYGALQEEDETGAEQCASEEKIDGETDEVAPTTVRGVYSASSTVPLRSLSRRLRPKVLLGRRTADLEQDEEQLRRSSAEYSIKSTGVEGQGSGASAVHFIVEVEEPSSGMCICRTCFLATRGGRISTLVRAYRNLCSALGHAAMAIARHPKWTSLKAVEEHAISAAHDAIMSSTLAEKNKIDPTATEPLAGWTLTALVRVIDACQASPVERSDRHDGLTGGGCIAYVRLMLSGSSGAVAVGDSYACVPLLSAKTSRKEHEGYFADGSQDGHVHQHPLLLTGFGCCPHLAVWGSAEGDEAKETFHLLRNLQDRVEVKERLGLGVSLNPGGTAMEEVSASMLFPDSLFPCADGKLRLFSAGLSFRTPGCAPIVVSLRPAQESAAAAASTSVISTAGIIEISREQTGLLLLLIKFRRDVLGKNPLAVAFPFLESMESLAVPLHSGSSLLQRVLEAITSWKEEAAESILFGSLAVSDVPSVMLDTLHMAHPTIVNTTTTNNGGGVRQQELTAAVADASVIAQKLIGINPAFRLAEFGQRDVMTTGMNDRGHEEEVLSERMREEGDSKGGAPDDNCRVSSTSDYLAGAKDDGKAEREKLFLPTTVLLGLPGSGVLSLAAAVLRFSSESMDWTSTVVVLPATDQADGMDEMELAEAIGRAVASVDVIGRATRVLVAVCADVGAAAVCAVLARWGTAERGLQIMSCTTCMRAVDTVPGEGGEERWRLFLMDQCAAGFVSNVVIVGEEGGRGVGSDHAWSFSREFRQRLHLANPSLAFLAPCSASYVNREALDSILRDGVFDSPLMIKIRRDELGPQWPTLCLLGITSSRMVNESRAAFDRGVETHDPSLEKKNMYRATQEVGMMEAWRLVMCLSALFPAAAVISTGIPEKSAGSLSCTTSLGSDGEMIGMEQADLKNGGVCGEQQAISSAESDTSISTGIRRAGELARDKILAQTHQQKIENLHTTIQRWIRQEEELTARDTTNSKVNSNQTTQNNKGGARSTSETTTRTTATTTSSRGTVSIVGVVQIASPNSSVGYGGHSGGDTAGREATTRSTGSNGRINTTAAFLEATPETIRFNGIPPGIMVRTTLGTGDEDRSVLVMMSCSSRKVRAVSSLLTAASGTTLSLPLQQKTRADLSATELESIRQEHQNDQLPTGWFFDGSVFVDYDGHRMKERPDLSEIIDKHLQLLNATSNVCL